MSISISREPDALGYRQKGRSSLQFSGAAQIKNCTFKHARVTSELNPYYSQFTQSWSSNYSTSYVVLLLYQCQACLIGVRGLRGRRGLVLDLILVWYCK